MVSIDGFVVFANYGTALKGSIIPIDPEMFILTKLETHRTCLYFDELPFNVAFTSFPP